MMQLSIFDAIASRDKVLDRVSDNAGDWIESALARIPTLSGEMTGEDIRFALVALVGEPHHSNAWGALIRTAKGRGLIENTGRYVPMRAANSHARITPVYRVTTIGRVINGSALGGENVARCADSEEGTRGEAEV